MKKLILIDGNALLHRAFHATPPLTTSKGELVNAVYGFTVMLMKVLDDELPDYIAVAWDMRAPTFRHVAYEGYKANRGPADETLSGQYDRVHELVGVFNIPEFKLPGFEADDLVGALAKQAIKKDKDLEVRIITGDKDIMQLIDKRIKVMMPRKTITDVSIYGEEEFMARFGFDPILMIDYKGLAGDPSDNIPGVSGIGDVTASKLIQKYGTVEEIYKHLGEIGGRTQKLLEEGEESAKMSKQLATIETDIPIKLDLKACQVNKFDPNKIKDLFEELEFRSLISKIKGLEESHPELVSGSETLKQVQSDKGPQNQATTDLDQLVIPILEKMTEVGVLVDVKFLERLGDELKKKLIDLERDIYKYVGHEFNINSPKQLSVILFDELNLPVMKKTKTGRSTDEETLTDLHDHHPVIPCLLEYRKLYKLISTYIDALPKYVKDDGRVHSTFNVEGAATGRLSSTNPNLQNIPIRGEVGSELRKAFIVPKDKVLLAADYSQIELRIMAHLSGDVNLMKAFEDNTDIHAVTASKIFKIPVDQINKDQRMVGKTMNFATLYGQGARALSKQLGVDYATAKNYIEEYFAQFPKVKDWMQKTLDQGYKTGFVETISGRRRYIPELQGANKFLKSFGERAAINHPVQGSSADMIKKAMVLIDKELTDKAQMILQVHDELLFEVDPKELDETAKMIKEKMEGSMTLDVPVTVELKSGPNWGEMTKIQM